MINQNVTPVSHLKPGMKHDNTRAMVVTHNGGVNFELAVEGSIAKNV